MEKLRILLLAIILACLCPIAWAEMECNNIYLFDVTESMKDCGIWDKAKNSLDRTLQNNVTSCPEATTHIIAFQDNPFPSIDFYAKDYNAKSGKTTRRESLMDSLDVMISIPHWHTHIVDALNAGNQLISPTRDNRIYLFTDGQDQNGAQYVADALKRWCGKYPNTRLFYIMLTDAAVNSAILEAAEMCPNIFVTTPVGNGVVPEYVDIAPNVIYTSTLELDKEIPFTLSIDKTVDLRIASSDPYFKWLCLMERAQVAHSRSRLPPSTLRWM